MDPNADNTMPADDEDGADDGAVVPEETPVTGAPTPDEEAEEQADDGAAGDSEGV